MFDSGGVYGTIPSSVLGTGQTSGYVPAGTTISVYSTDGQTLLYSYTTTASNALSVTSGGTMETGYDTVLAATGVHRLQPQRCRDDDL